MLFLAVLFITANKRKRDDLGYNTVFNIRGFFFSIDNEWASKMQINQEKRST
jgi:hypothetical protein